MFLYDMYLKQIFVFAFSAVPLKPFLGGRSLVSGDLRLLSILYKKMLVYYYIFYANNLCKVFADFQSETMFGCEFLSIPNASELRSAPIYQIKSKMLQYSYVQCVRIEKFTSL